MNTAITTTKTSTTVDAPSVSERLAGVAIGSILSLSTMVSLWSFASLAGAVATNSATGIAHGLLTALTGI